MNENTAAYINVNETEALLDDILLRKNLSIGNFLFLNSFHSFVLIVVHN